MKEVIVEPAHTKDRTYINFKMKN